MGTVRGRLWRGWYISAEHSWYNLAEHRWYILAEHAWYILGEHQWCIFGEHGWYIYVQLLTPALLPEESPPAGAERQFATDFGKHSVPYSEILSGGPPKDGIPAIDEPRFVTAEEADDWLEPQEPVIFLQIGDDARAYPIQVLMWHEIVNDTVGGVPVLVTFCPLCNTAIGFERTLDSRVLDLALLGDCATAT